MSRQEQIKNQVDEKIAEITSKKVKDWKKGHPSKSKRGSSLLEPVDVEISVAIAEDGTWYAYGSSEHNDRSEQDRWALDALDCSGQKYVTRIKAKYKNKL
jgi:hypothetical protein